MMLPVKRLIPLLNLFYLVKTEDYFHSNTLFYKNYFQIMKGTGLIRILLMSKTNIRFSSNGGYFVSQLPHTNVRSPFADPSRIAVCVQYIFPFLIFVN